METLFIFLLVGGATIAVIGSVIWVGFIIYAGVKTSDLVNTVSRSGGSNVYASTSDLDALLGQLDRALRKACTARVLGGHAGGAHLPPRKQLEIQKILMQTQSKICHLDSLSRQRYETRMADLSGMAASAGIDWTPESY